MVNSREKIRINIVDKNGRSLYQVMELIYLEGMVCEEGEFNLIVRMRISLSQKKWRELSGVINVRNIPRKISASLESHCLLIYYSYAIYSNIIVLSMPKYSFRSKETIVILLTLIKII